MGQSRIAVPHVSITNFFPGSFVDRDNAQTCRKAGTQSYEATALRCDASRATERTETYPMPRDSFVIFPLAFAMVAGSACAGSDLPTEVAFSGPQSQDVASSAGGELARSADAFVNLIGVNVRRAISTASMGRGSRRSSNPSSPSSAFGTFATAVRSTAITTGCGRSTAVCATSLRWVQNSP